MFRTEPPEEVAQLRRADYNCCCQFIVVIIVIISITTAAITLITVAANVFAMRLISSKEKKCSTLS